MVTNVEATTYALGLSVPVTVKNSAEDHRGGPATETGVIRLGGNAWKVMHAVHAMPVPPSTGVLEWVTTREVFLGLRCVHGDRVTVIFRT